MLNKKTRRLIRLFIYLSIIILGLYYTTKVEPGLLMTKEYRLVGEYDEIDGLKIVHFSDLHFGYHFEQEAVDHVIEEINHLKPDIVFFTGDLFDETSTIKQAQINQMIQSLEKIQTTYGKFAVLGNHDKGFEEELEKIYANSGFNLLINETFDLYLNQSDVIQILGFDDYMFGTPKMEEEILQDVYTIGLVHEPDYILKVDENKFDLFLSGHTHGGQVGIPIYGGIFYPPLGKELNRNTTIGDMQVFVNSGIGMTMLPMRFASIPTINLYRLSTNK